MVLAKMKQQIFATFGFSAQLVGIQTRCSRPRQMHQTVLDQLNDSVEKISNEQYSLP